MDGGTEITTLAEARDLVRLQLLDQSRETAETAALLTDELLANALEHGAGDPRLELDVDACQLVVRVVDHDPSTDVGPLPLEPMRKRGRGLVIVGALATAWGVERYWDAKVVWFSLDL